VHVQILAQEGGTGTGTGSTPGSSSGESESKGCKQKVEIDAGTECEDCTEWVVTQEYSCPEGFDKTCIHGTLILVNNVIVKNSLKNKDCK